jgi:hypothetical protein
MSYVLNIDTVILFYFRYANVLFFTILEFIRCHYHKTLLKTELTYFS